MTCTPCSSAEVLLPSTLLIAVEEAFVTEERGMDEEDDVTTVFSLALAAFAAVEDEFMTEEGDMVDDMPEVF